MSDHLDHASGITPSENLQRQPGLLDVAGDFVQSAVYAGVQSPATGFLQIVDEVAHTDLSHKLQFMSAPQSSKFGSLDWHAQQIGGAVGMVLPFLLLSKGLEMKEGLLANPVASSTAAGAVYGAVFQPSSPGGNFLLSRLENAAVSGATFGTLTATGSLLGSLAESRFVTSDLVSGLLKNGAFAGVASGLPAGIVSAEGNSLAAGRGWLAPQQLLQSMYGFSMAGGVFGALHGLERPQAEQQPQAAPPVEGEQPGVTLLLRGGAVRGWGHIGVLKYLDEQGVKVDHEYGISIGALIAGLHKNGYSGDEIQNIFLDEFHNPLVKKYLPQNLTLRSLIRFKNLEPMMARFAEKYNLQPNDGLHIFAFSLRQRKPFLFEGTDYSLPKALRASAGIPGPFRWTKVEMDPEHRMILLDGGFRHITASDLPQQTTNLIISSLNDPPETPTAPRPHTLGTSMYKIGGRVFSRLLKNDITVPDGTQHVISAGKPGITSLAFSLPDEAYLSMVDHGYEQAKAVLGPAIEAGDLPLRNGAPLVPALEQLQPITPLPLWARLTNKLVYPFRAPAFVPANLNSDARRSAQ